MFNNHFISVICKLKLNIPFRFSYLLWLQMKKIMEPIKHILKIYYNHKKKYNYYNSSRPVNIYFLKEKDTVIIKSQNYYNTKQNHIYNIFNHRTHTPQIILSQNYIRGIIIAIKIKDI